MSPWPPNTMRVIIMVQKKIGIACVAVTCLVLGLSFMANTDSADAGGLKPKIDKARLKLILNRTDPEIKAAQKALQVARTDLLKARTAIKKAMADEVFGEKGATEAAAIDRLKLSLKACERAITDVNVALTQANIAQLVDKSGD